jgi:hypothetical protein
MDTVKMLAKERAFYTAEVELQDYGRVLLIGDQEAVERVLAILGQHKNHTLTLVPEEPS